MWWMTPLLMDSIGRNVNFDAADCALIWRVAWSIGRLFRLKAGIPDLVLLRKCGRYLLSQITISQMTRSLIRMQVF